ncbi:MAG: hypothetical protein GY947_13875 [Rhodobacteraceae bacterium]|nr:hypothetical protein [Paracoccaceae bacterium]
MRFVGDSNKAHNALAAEISEDIRLGRDLRNLRSRIETLQQAYAIQDRLTAHLEPVAGRKIAWNLPALMQRYQVDGPVAARVFGCTIRPDGAELALRDYVTLALEPEMAAVVGQDIAPGTSLDSENISNYINRLLPAFEVVDRRNAGAETHAPTLVANNVLSAGGVLGQGGIGSTDYASKARRTVFDADGNRLLDGIDTAPENPLKSALFTIRHFLARGETIMAGEVLFCGAHHPPLIVPNLAVTGFPWPVSVQSDCQSLTDRPDR